MYMYERLKKNVLGKEHDRERRNVSRRNTSSNQVLKSFTTRAAHVPRQKLLYTLDVMSCKYLNKIINLIHVLFFSTRGVYKAY